MYHHSASLQGSLYHWLQGKAMSQSLTVRSGTAFLSNFSQSYPERLYLTALPDSAWLTRLRSGKAGCSWLSICEFQNIWYYFRIHFEYSGSMSNLDSLLSFIETHTCVFGLIENLWRPPDLGPQAISLFILCMAVGGSLVSTGLCLKDLRQTNHKAQYVLGYHAVKKKKDRHLVKNKRLCFALCSASAYRHQTLPSSQSSIDQMSRTPEDLDWSGGHMLSGGVPVYHTPEKPNELSMESLQKYKIDRWAPSVYMYVYSDLLTGKLFLCIQLWAFLGIEIGKYIFLIFWV